MPISDYANAYFFVHRARVTFEHNCRSDFSKAVSFGVRARGLPFFRIDRALRCVAYPYKRGDGETSLPQMPAGRRSDSPTKQKARLDEPGFCNPSGAGSPT